MIAGPIVRRVTQSACHVWLVTPEANAPAFALTQHGATLKAEVTGTCVQVGKHAFIHLLSATVDESFTANVPIYYQLTFTATECQEKWQQEQADLLYANQTALSFCWTNKPETLLHLSLIHI